LQHKGLQQKFARSAPEVPPISYLTSAMTLARRSSRGR
jgi:hypothetical protein